MCTPFLYCHLIQETELSNLHIFINIQLLIMLHLMYFGSGLCKVVALV